MYGASTNKKLWRYLTVLFALLWVGGATLLALPWIGDLAETISWPGAIWVVAGIALFPGYLAAWLWSGILFYRPAPLRLRRPSWPPVRVLVAAWNEEEALPETLRAIENSGYPGQLRILVIDDGSTDGTRGAAGDVPVLSVPHRGKAEALNRAIAACREELILSLDADTHPLPGSITRLVARQLEERCAAVAGTVLVRNTHDSVWAGMQQWDYHLGISAVKRSQALWRATLVAQGSFSLYRRSFLHWGWEKMVGEDIVLSWRILREGEIVFEDTAVALTEVPRTLRSFARQRRRWARGMIEGLRTSGRELFRRRSPARHGVFWAALFPWVDSAYAFAFLPGILLALGGNYLIVGIWTLLLLPLQALLFGTQALLQRRSLREAGYRHPSGAPGFLLYMFFYQALLSPISLWGYLEEIFKRDHRW